MHRKIWDKVSKEGLTSLLSVAEDTAEHDEIRDRLLSGGKVYGTNLVVMICAIIIASAGLYANSTAVIIGAMLISPLMGSILAIAYGAASTDFETIRKYMSGFLLQIAFSVAASTVFFMIAPYKEATHELLARTSPGIIDMIIAFAGGTAGIIGQTREDKANNIIPGVAIATALMPPLCTCGYGIAEGKWNMVWGAIHLFGVNAYFIYLSAVIVLSLLKVPHVKELSEMEWMKKRSEMFRMVAGAIIQALLYLIFIF